MRELRDYRDQFPILAETTYLINHSLGAMPVDAERRLADYAHTWKTRGIRAWSEGWWELPLTVGDQIGRIVGAPPGTTTMHQNVTIAEAVVLSCFRFEGERRRIVYEEGKGRVAQVTREKPVQTGGRPPRHEHEQPLRDSGSRGGDRPAAQPEVVWEGQQPAEEDGETGAA